MGFFKNIARSFTSKIGEVSGSDFNNRFLAKSNKDGLPALVIYMTGTKDYLFNKNDVKEFNLLESNVFVFKQGDNQYIGSKYRVTFKDGKTAILNVPAGNCKDVEKVLY